MRKPWILAMVVAAALAHEPASAVADDFATYRVRKGDTLDLLAAEYYGDRNHAIFLMVANGMTHAAPLRPGQRLRIPISREVTTRPDDTFATLAQAHLGDLRRADFLAEYNGLQPGDSLAVGTALQVPFTVTHTAAGAERLVDVSAAYFGDLRNALMIRGYNFLETDTLAPGQRIIIPIVHISVRQAKLPPLDDESKARKAKREQIATQAARALATARAAWRGSDYAQVKRALAGLDTSYLDTAQAVEIGVLLGAAYVAFADDDSAIAAFRTAIARRPKHALDPYLYSPRILGLWSQAGGASPPAPPK